MRETTGEPTDGEKLCIEKLREAAERLKKAPNKDAMLKILGIVDSVRYLLVDEIKKL